MKPAFRLILAFPNVGLEKALENRKTLFPDKSIEYISDDWYREQFSGITFPGNYICEIRKILGDSNAPDVLIVDGSIILAKFLEGAKIPYALVCRDSEIADVHKIFEGMSMAVLQYYIDSDDSDISAIVRLAGMDRHPGES